LRLSRRHPLKMIADLINRQDLSEKIIYLGKISNEAIWS
jgi:hypothetical protein